jgi:hypothetical protein
VGDGGIFQGRLVAASAAASPAPAVLSNLLGKFNAEDSGETRSAAEKYLVRFALTAWLFLRDPPRSSAVRRVGISDI